MLEKGRKRQERPVAVVYFVIGLVVLLAILAMLYFALFEVDYSDQIRDPESTIRAYVESTPVPEDYAGDPSEAVTPVPEMLTTPEPTVYAFDYDYDETVPAEDSLTAAFDEAANTGIVETPIDTAVELPEAAEQDTEPAVNEAETQLENSIGDETALTDVPADTEAQAAAPVEELPAADDLMEAETLGIEESVLADTPAPTPLMPEDTPLPEIGGSENTPEPAQETDVLEGLDAESAQTGATPVPDKLLAKAKKGKFKVPKKPSDEYGKLGITKCDLPEGDNKSVMHLAGYGYRNVAKFNGAKCKSYLILIQKSNGKMKAYPLTMQNGASGLAHSGAECQNASASDFECYISVKNFEQDIYNLALVMQTGKKSFYYYTFDDMLSFTIVGGQVVSPLVTATAE